MLKRAIIFLIAGVTLPYIGMWFSGTFLLGNGEEPNFLPMRIASSFALFLSVGLYFLSEIEKNFSLRIVCVLVAVAYLVFGVGSFLSAEGQGFYHLANISLFLKVVIAVLAGVLVLRNCRVVDEKI